MQVFITLVFLYVIITGNCCWEETGSFISKDLTVSKEDIENVLNIYSLMVILISIIGFVSHSIYFILVAQ